MQIHVVQVKGGGCEKKKVEKIPPVRKSSSQPELMEIASVNIMNLIKPCYAGYSGNLVKAFSIAAFRKD